MPRQPDAAFQPDIDIDIDKAYIIELTQIEEQPSKFRDKRKDAMTMVHHWLIRDQDTGVAIIDNTTGDMFDLWQFTPDGTYANPSNGKIAPARVIANALLDKTLTDDDVKDLLQRGWDKALVGKYALADFNWETGTDGSERLRIIRLRPYRKPGVRTTVAEITPSEETPEQKKARLIAELEAMTGVPPR